MTFIKELVQRSWPTTVPVALAVCLTLLQAHQQQPKSNYAELVSCALSWGLVYGLLRAFQTTARVSGDEGHAVWKYWAAAVVITVTEWFGSDMSWLWPLVTALLVLFHRVSRLSGYSRISKEGLLTALGTTSSTTENAVPLRRVLEASGIAAFSLACFLSQSHSPSLQTVGASVASVIAWTAVFAALQILSVASGDHTAAEGSDVLIVLGRSIAWRVAVLLGGLCVLFPIFLPPQLLHWSVATRALIAAGQWAAFFAMVRVEP